MKAKVSVFSKVEKRIENNSKMLDHKWPEIVKQFNASLPKTEEEVTAPTTKVVGFHEP
jgi:hypothetical protein